MKQLRIVSGMITENQISIILNCLKKTLPVHGSVVELGCNVGTTSVYIQRFLDGKKTFHVYDSFEGLPEKSEHDRSDTFFKGSCQASLAQFIDHFEEFELPLPEIHIGWFLELNYPEEISFAFFDGDFYTSIIDSFEKVYPRLSPGAIICVHDYGYDQLPGVKTACDAYLENKPEIMGVYDNIGIMVKL